MTYRSIWVCISVADSRLTRSYLHPLTQLHFLLELPRSRRLFETASNLALVQWRSPQPILPAKRAWNVRNKHQQRTVHTTHLTSE